MLYLFPCLVDFEHGADVNARSNDGSTPFSLALRFGHTKIAQAFIQHGADSSANDNEN